MFTSPGQCSSSLDWDRFHDSVAAGLSVYRAERIRRKSRFAEAAAMELPDGPPGPIEIDAAIGFLVDILESAGEPTAALAVLYVAAFLPMTPRRMRDAVEALATCGVETLGFAAAARAAAVEPIHGRPTIAARWDAADPGDWGLDDRVGTPLAEGDVVRDAHREDGPLMIVKALSTDVETGEVLALCEFVNAGGRVWRVRLGEVDLVRVPRPIVEPTGAPRDGGASDDQ